MNHLTTEPIESKTDNGSSILHGTAIAEKAAVPPTAVETVAVAKPTKTRPTFVPPLDPTVGIELRVTRAGIPARRLRINSTRCTFGSGEGCTVRLSDASLRPLHAVILRDGGRIMIRGYSVPLEINGQHVVESFLSLGDVVRLGHYCFEMIDLPITETNDHGYEDETVETLRSHLRHGEVAGASVENQSTRGRAGLDAAMRDIATEESSSTDVATNPKRLKFSQAASSSHKTSSRPSSSQSVLDGLQVPQSSVQVIGRSDDLVLEKPAVREPVTSLAQIHVQAKRNSELMADLAATRQREQEANEKLALTVDQLEAARTEIAQAAETADALKLDIAGLSDQVLKLAGDAREQESIAAAEQVKLNRAIASLRESGAASQKAEAATRQALQESIRQRDDTFAQRAVAIDAEQLTRAKLVEAEAQIRRLNQQAGENANLLTRFEAEADKARTRIDDLKDVCCGQADQITKLSTALENSQSSELATATRLKSTVDQLQAELNASRQLVRNADVERVQLSTLQSTLDSTLHQHLAEKLSWDAHLAQMRQEIEQLSVELKKTTDELSRSRSESTSLQSQISEMRSTVANVEAELSLRPTAGHLQEVRSQLALSESDYQDAEQRLAQLREDYDQLASQRVATQPAAAEPALQPRALSASIPMAVFPVPVFVDPTTGSKLAVEATHASNVQEIVASAAAAFALQQSESDSHVAEKHHAASDHSPSWSSDPTGGVVLSPPDDAAVEQSKLSQSSSEQQPALKQSPPTSVSDSSWKSPSSVAPGATAGGWVVSQQKVMEDGPLQPSPSSVAANGGAPVQPETQSQWLTSSHSRTEMMRDADDEMPLHTEPMNRFSGESFSGAKDERAAVDYSSTHRLGDVANQQMEHLTSWSATSTSSGFETEDPIDGQPAADFAAVQDDDQSQIDAHLAAMIQRSEGTSSSWFADYTAKQSGDEEPAELEDADDNAAVLARLSQYVHDKDTPEDDNDGATDENQYDAMDPEASALSLARMLINELDSATTSDRDSRSGYGGPDPMVKSKRLVGAAVADVGISSDDHTNDEDEASINVEMRRKDFDERAFRDSFSGSAVEDAIDPNADEAAYRAPSESTQGPTYRSTTSLQAVEEEEDSVEAYMNQLLRRMGQEPLAATPAVAEPRQPSMSKFTPPQQRETTREMPEVIRPKRTAPELEVPMDQMRELANQSAASAISTSNRKGAKELRSKALVDGAQAGIIVVCALVFFYCGTTSSNLKLVWNTAGALALALSIFFLYEMARKLTASSVSR